MTKDEIRTAIWQVRTAVAGDEPFDDREIELLAKLVLELCEQANLADQEHD